MKEKRTRLLLAASAIALLSTGVSSQAAGVFTGLGDGTSWEDAANWDDNIVPASGAGLTFIPLGNKTILFDAATWSALSSAGKLSGAGGTTGDYTAVQRLLMGESNSGTDNGTQTLTFNHGGTNKVAMGSGSSGVLGGRSGKTSILNLQSGILDIGAGAFTVGAAGNGSLDVSGGQMIFGRAELSVGTNAGTGAVTVSDGSLSTRNGLNLGANGTFSVVGSGASQIGIGSSGTDGNGGWSQLNSGILKMMVDTSVTKIFLKDGTNAGVPTATFAAGAILDLGFTGAFANGSWTLMEVENGIIDNGGSNMNLVLDAADIAAGWSYTVDNSGPNGLLIANFTAVPEPSVALLGFITLGLLFVRHRG